MGCRCIPTRPLRWLFSGPCVSCLGLSDRHPLRSRSARSPPMSDFASVSPRVSPPLAVDHLTRDHGGAPRGLPRIPSSLAGVELHPRALLLSSTPVPASAPRTAAPDHHLQRPSPPAWVTLTLPIPVPAVSVGYPGDRDAGADRRIRRIHHASLHESLAHETDDSHTVPYCALARSRAMSGPQMHIYAVGSD